MFFLSRWRAFPRVAPQMDGALVRGGWSWRAVGQRSPLLE